MSRVSFEVQYRRECDNLTNRGQGFDPHSQVSKMRFHERNIQEAKIEDTRCQVCHKVLATITSRKRHEAIAFFLVFV